MCHKRKILNLIILLKKFFLNILYLIYFLTIK